MKNEKINRICEIIFFVVVGVVILIERAIFNASIHRKIPIENAVTDSTKFIITSNGRTGIETLAPEYPLDIFSDGHRVGRIDVNAEGKIVFKGDLDESAKALLRAMSQRWERKHG